MNLKSKFTQNRFRTSSLHIKTNILLIYIGSSSQATLASLLFDQSFMMMVYYPKLCVILNSDGNLTQNGGWLLWCKLQGTTSLEYCPTGYGKNCVAGVGASFTTKDKQILRHDMIKRTTLVLTFLCIFYLKLISPLYTSFWFGSTNEGFPHITDNNVLTTVFKPRGASWEFILQI